jgi:hypothetical protein
LEVITRDLEKAYLQRPTPPISLLKPMLGGYLILSINFNFGFEI